MNRVVFSTVVVMLLSAGMYAAVSDHVLEIEISTTFDYDLPELPLRYEFDAWIRVDGTVVSGTLQVPGGNTYAMQLDDEDEGERWLGVYVDSPDLSGLDDFGPGTYTFTVNYSSGGSDSTSIDYTLPNGDPIPYITQEPQFIYPQHNGVNVPLDIFLQITPASNPDWTIGITVDPADESLDVLTSEIEGLPFNTGSYGPVRLSPATLYDIEYTFNHVVRSINTDGIPAVVDTDAECEIRFTTTPAAISITKCKAKAGKVDNTDAIQIAGTLNVTEGHLNAANSIVVTVNSDPAYMPEPYVASFDILAGSVKKGKYRSPKIKSAVKTDPKESFKVETKKGKFTFVAKNIDLTGLGCPLSFKVEIGSYVAQVQLDEPIVNGKKPIPIQFMMGVKNSLRVDKVKVKKGKKFDTDSISVKGAFTVADTYDKNAPVAITVGSDTFTVPGQLFDPKRAVESCKKTPANEGPIVSAKFDSSKCTFTIRIKYARLSDTGNVDFSIDLFDNYLLAPDQIPVPPDPPRPVLYEFEALRHYARPQDRGSWWNYDADYTMTGTNNESGSTHAMLRIGSSPEYIDGHACNEVSMSAGGGTMSSWWYEDNVGTHMMGQGNNALGNFDIRMDSALTVPRFLETGKQYSSSKPFHGSVDGVFGDGYGISIEVVSFSGKAGLTAKVLGEEPVSVPAGSYASAVKVEETLTISGNMPLEIDYYGEHLKATAKYTAKIHQIWWSVPEIGVVKVDTAMTVKLSLKGESESLELTETDVLTSYGPK